MNMARREHKQRGAALIIALGMLAVFAALGTAYLGYMVLEQQRSQDYLAEVQARQLAERAVWAAVGELQTALTNGEAPALGAHDEQLLPLYRAVIEGTPEPWSRRDGWVRLAIEDESAKLNINLASPRVLQAMRGVDGDKARSIRSQVPRPGEAPGPEQRWFASVDGLVEQCDVLEGGDCTFERGDEGFDLFAVPASCTELRWCRRSLFGRRRLAPLIPYPPWRRRLYGVRTGPDVRRVGVLLFGGELGRNPGGGRDGSLTISH